MCFVFCPNIIINQDTIHNTIKISSISALELFGLKITMYTNELLKNEQTKYEIYLIQTFKTFLYFDA